MNPYNTVPIAKPGYSVQDLSHNLRTTMEIGQVKPTCFFEVVPGDYIQLNQTSVCELAPLVSQFKGDLYLETWFFYLSYDLLYNKEVDTAKFSDILLSVTNPQETVPNIPKWSVTSINDFKVNTLWDSFGFPVNLNKIPNEKVLPLAYLKRAYNLVYNEYIRDENLDEEIDLENNSLLNVRYKKDRFTSAFTSPQKGIAPTMKITGSANIVFPSNLLNAFVGQIVNYQSFSTGLDDTGHATQVPQGTMVKTTFGSNSPNFTYETLEQVTKISNPKSNLVVKIDNSFLNALNTASVTLTGIEAFSINDLRLLNKLQLWLERNQLCGTRYKEYLLANYGTAPVDETLQRPALIGRTRQPIVVNSVLQTSDSDNSPLGTRAGVGSCVGAFNVGKFKAKEFGLVLGVSFLRPKASYGQGINRMWIKQSVYDFYNPIFQSLGQQEILNAEIFCDGSDNDLQPFGFTDRNNEMRSIDDIYTGELREQDYKNWSVMRTFSNRPTLSSEFLEVKSSDYDYLFAVDSSESPQAFVSFGNMIKATRPLSKLARPSL